MAGPKVAVVVLNWNRAPETLRCLDSLRALTYPVDVMVVDNGSTDGSAAAMRAARPDLPLLETGANLGYAGGNNVGIRAALGRGAQFVLVLNNDTIVQTPDLVERLLAAAARIPNCGLVGPAMVPMERPDAEVPLRVRWRGRLVNRIALARLRGVRDGEAAARGLPPGAKVRVVPSLTGFALGIFRPVLEATEGFDASYFMYDEEHDLCLRAARLGYASVWAGDARVLRPSDPPGRSVPPYKAYYLARNRFFTAERFGAWTRAVLLALHAVNMLDLAVHLLRTGQRGSLPLLWRGVRDGLAGRRGPLVSP